MFRKIFPYCLVMFVLVGGLGYTEGYTPRVGEVLEYKVIVKSAIHGGNQKVQVLSKDIYNGREVYRIHSEMLTVGLAKTLFRFQQEEDLILDAEGLYPLFIKKKTQERKETKIEEVSFDYVNKIAIRLYTKNDEPQKCKEIALPGFIQDELSIQFFLRKNQTMNSENKIFYYGNGKIDEKCFKVSQVDQEINLDCGDFSRYIQIIDDISNFSVYVSDTPERLPLVVKTKGNIGLIEMKLVKVNY